MPTLLNVRGYRFFFYANDHPPRHVHIEKGHGTAKFNLFPVELVRSRRFKAAEINTIRKLVLENRELFNQKWDEYFSHK
jgi:hypothetical protein